MADARADRAEARQDVADARADHTEGTAATAKLTVAALRTEVSELKAGTLSLTSQVESLSGALSAMNEIQVAQRRQAAEIKEVKKDVLPKEERERLQKQAEERERAYRQSVLTKMSTAGVIALALFIAAGIFVSNQLDAQAREDYRQCLAGNATVDKVGAFLVAVSENSIVPEIKQSASDVLGSFEGRTRECEAP